MNELRNLLDLRDCSRDIRSMWASNEPRLLREQLAQLIQITNRVFGIRCRPPLHLQAQSSRDPNPGCRIGFVVQLREHQLIAGFELERGRKAV
jgi:hypothetical protein